MECTCQNRGMHTHYGNPYLSVNTDAFLGKYKWKTFLTSLRQINNINLLLIYSFIIMINNKFIIINQHFKIKNFKIKKHSPTVKAFMLYLHLTCNDEQKREYEEEKVIIKGFHTIKGGTPESATEIGGAPGITRDVGQVPTVTRSKY